MPPVMAHHATPATRLIRQARDGAGASRVPIDVGECNAKTSTHRVGHEVVQRPSPDRGLTQYCSVSIVIVSRTAVT